RWDSAKFLSCATGRERRWATSSICARFTTRWWMRAHCRWTCWSSASMHGLRRKGPAGREQRHGSDRSGRDILGSSQSRRAIAPKISLLLPILLRQERVFMKRFLVLVLAILGLSCALNAQVTDTTVCDVVKKPAPFDGKIVRIKGTVVAGFDEFAIKDAADPNCGFPVNAIWLAYPQGSKGKAGAMAMLTIQPARNYTGNYTAPTRSAVTLTKDKEFKQLDSLLAQTHQKGADMCLGCMRYEVTATLVGRLDTVADA